MGQCKICGSYAINVGKMGRDEADADLCDVCYWKKRVEQLEAKIDGMVSTCNCKRPRQDTQDKAGYYCEKCHGIIEAYDWI